MKNLILVLVVVSLLISSPSVALSQNLQGHEWSIYYDVVEEWHRQLYLTDHDPFEAEDNAANIAANKYGYTKKEIYALMDKGYGDRFPADSEIQIYDELIERINELPEGASEARHDSIHREVANKYGLTLSQLYELEYRAYFDYFLW